LSSAGEGKKGHEKETQVSKKRGDEKKKKSYSTTRAHTVMKTSTRRRKLQALRDGKVGGPVKFPTMHTGPDKQNCGEKDNNTIGANGGGG